MWLIARSVSVIRIALYRYSRTVRGRDAASNNLHSPVLGAIDRIQEGKAKI